MNPFLKNIADLVEGSTIKDKQVLLNALAEADKQWAITDFKLERTEKVKKTTSILLEETIHELEQKRKAVEAQNRELEIEACLERVRAKVMAMNNSSDLTDTSLVFGEQLRKLGVDWAFSYFWLIEEDKDSNTFWITWPDGQTSVTTYPLSEVDQFTAQCLLSWKKGEKIHANHLPPEDTHIFFETFKKIIEEAGGIALELMVPGNFTKGIYYSDAMMRFGSFGVCMNRVLTPEEEKIQGRFAIEFERAYTRFLDLQKSEAQAHEARIEASLERVRSKAMAMHTSEELASAISSFYHEIELLSITPRRCGVAMMDKQTRVAELFTMNTTGKGESKVIIGTLKMEGHPVLDAVFEHWLEQKEYHAVLRGQEIKEYYKIIRPQIDFPDYPHDLVQYGYYFMFKEGDVVAWTDKELTDEELKIYRRFTTVLSLTFKRYMDLQHAEAQAREARIEAALERVRAKAMAMQKSEDLNEAVAIVFQQLEKLELGVIRCGIGIMDREKRAADVWVTTITGEGSAVQVAGDESFDIHPLLHNAYESWLKQEDYSYTLSGQDMIDYYKALGNTNFHLPESQLILTDNSGPRAQYYHLSVFEAGGLFAFSESPFTFEEKKTLKRFADVFNLTYTRFMDLQHAERNAKRAEEDLVLLKEEKKRTEETLKELRATQAQLIQSEKMASLGELTAGIAHEIQNPLNFVNNFSEVSSELLDEMQAEIQKGNTADAIEIADSVRQNLQKILHHGKRADGIVKGMLQHSRTGSGQKELTDINALADEYLRLAYHGLRAKDKSFNARFETDFDNTIGKINVLPQDMGRVILNLINNAFYAVSSKATTRPHKNYTPTVSIATKKVGNKVKIMVKDNGNGIPSKVLDKIFQPFFTTKPTGQGTGLGLSLSYDIITKGHGGEMSVETKEEEGSVFNIQIPV